MATDDYLDDVQLKQAIWQHIKNETFVLTKHAAEEQKKDGIDLQDTLHILMTGIHEREKTGFDNRLQSWKYAIRGKTESLETARVIIAFANKMMIITVIKLRKNR